MALRQSSRERILDTALLLFNERGTHTVTTNHIAESTGLSVGNLYYHFKNKEEIIRALYQRLTARTAAAFVLSADRPPEIADLERLLLVNFEILYDFRFLYRELLALLQRDPLLAEQYRQVRENGFANFAVLFGYFHQSGILRATDAAEIDRLAEICWILSEFYLPFIDIGGQPLTRDRLAHGVALLRQAFRPYLSDALRTEMESLQKETTL